MPTIIIQTDNPPQEKPLLQEEIEAYKALLSEPARPDDPVHQYIRKEARKCLSQITDSVLSPSDLAESTDPEVKLWMSAVFGKTLRKIKQITPLPGGRTNDFLDDMPEISVTKFTRHPSTRKQE